MERQDSESGPRPYTPAKADALKGRAELRAERAERRAEREGPPWRYYPGHLPLDEVRRVIHQLRVQQIDLEIRNEELEGELKELRAARDHHRELHERVPVAYFTLGERDVILEANPAAAGLLEMEREALVGRIFRRFVARSGRDAWDRARRLLSGTESPQRLELALHRADGSRLWGLVDMAWALDAREHPVARVVVTDLTWHDQEEMGRRRRDRRSLQAEKAASLTRMAGAVAHRFNNLLGATVGNVELALADLPEGSPGTEALGDALVAARDAAEVNRRLLGCLGQGPGESDPAVEDLSRVCRRLLPLLRAALPPGVELVAELPTPGPSVRIVGSQIHEVVTNLLTNAWEARKGGSEGIRLAVGTVVSEEIPEGRRYPVDWTPVRGSYASLTVSDPGEGIPAHLLDRIFDPFFSTKSLGRGLGLSMVLGTVKAHGGAVTVGRALPTGSVFTVYLPLAAPLDPASLEPAPGRWATGGAEVPAETATDRGDSQARGAVLVVDDDELVRRMASRVLARLGYHVLPAVDGVEALELFREHRASVSWVLCDLTMPRMNGWDTLAALRTLDPRVRVVLTSGFDEAQALSWAPSGERPNAFLSKPWTPRELAAAARAGVAEQAASPPG
jgi:two-component system, cell cycle sensor histidine kinase and response regulator CckA